MERNIMSSTNQIGLKIMLNVSGGKGSKPKEQMPMGKVPVMPKGKKKVGY